jgi:hypothetical protein
MVTKLVVTFSKTRDVGRFLVVDLKTFIQIPICTLNSKNLQTCVLQKQVLRFTLGGPFRIDVRAFRSVTYFWPEKPEASGCRS